MDIAAKLIAHENEAGAVGGYLDCPRPVFRLVSAVAYLRWRIFARIRRFFRPTFRRPVPRRPPIKHLLEPRFGSLNSPQQPRCGDHNLRDKKLF